MPSSGRAEGGGFSGDQNTARRAGQSNLLRSRARKDGGRRLGVCRKKNSAGRPVPTDTNASETKRVMRVSGYAITGRGSRAEGMFSAVRILRQGTGGQ